MEFRRVLSRSTQHGRFRFDAAHAPAEHAQTVNHSRVTVRTDAGVGISHCRARGVRRSPDRLRNIFKIHLVADASAGRHNLEVIERLGTPFQKLIALAIRSEEHTSELQSLMRISYAVFCLKKKNNKHST